MTIPGIPLGTVVTCETGHSLYRVVSDLDVDARPDLDDLVRLDGRAAAPAETAIMNTHCPHCGSRWARFMTRGLKLHSAAGWLPA